MNKSFLLVLFLVLIHLYHVRGQSTREGEKKKPNFIFILTDDQRMDALGANGNDKIITPSIDRLGRKAKHFSNANVVFALCSPSRAAILTGRFGSSNGVLELGSKLNEGEKSLATYLKAHGYLTGFSGKWHLGQTPKSLGFDFSVYFEGNGAYYNRLIYDGKEKKYPAQHCDEYCVDRSIDFISEVAGKEEPFFLFHCTQLPHMDGNLLWNAKLETLGKYEVEDMPVAASHMEDLSGKPEYLKSVRNLTKAADYGYPDPKAIQRHTLEYYAVITEMDDALGRLIDSIEKAGLMENTYLIFMSDNGWMLGEHGFTSKVLPYRPSSQVPFFILGPDISNTVEDEIILNIDIVPTILELAGAEIPANVQGSSIVPLLQSNNHDWRQAFVYEGLGSYGGAKPNLTVFDGRFRYIVTYEDKSLETVDFIELYDNNKDAEEVNNLYGKEEYSKVIGRLEKHIANHKNKILLQSN